VEEISSGVRTIAGVATSITAFVGRTDRGPVDEPTTIHSFADFERIFGGLSYESTLSYAVRDFYLNGGQEAIILRLYSPLFDEKERSEEEKKAETEATDAANKINNQVQSIQSGNSGKDAADVAETYANGIPADPKNGKDAANFVASAARNAVTLPALVADKAKEAADNVFATKINAYPAAVAVANAATSYIKSHLDCTAEQVASAITTEATNQTKIADAALPTNPSAADAQKCTDIKDKVKAVADAANGVVSTLDKIKIIVSEAVNRAVSAAKASAAPRSYAQITYDSLVFQATNPGSWGNKLRVRVDNDGIEDEGLPDLGLKKSDLFNLTVRDTQRGTTEHFINVTTKILPDTSRRLDKVLESGSSLISLVTALPAATPQNHGDPDPGKNIWTDDKSSAGVSNDLSAADSKPLISKDYLADPRGIYSLRKVDQFNLLCIPPDRRPPDRRGVSSSDEDTQGADTPINVLSEAMKLCVDSRAMLIVDPPYQWGAKKDEAAKNAANGLSGLGLNGIEARNAILYFPRVIQSDPLREGQLDTFAPCGLIAGVIARTDMQRGIWKAPAGVDASMNGIIGLKVTLNDAENGMLNPLGINCLRTFPLYGSIVWGARTLRGANQMADEYKYVPVRRVALFIEESLYRGLKWVVFEPNDEPLWSQVRLNVGAFMHNLFRQGAFQGKSPREAYFVKCDKETTTQSDIDQGIVNVVVGFAPLKPAEFVVIKIQQMAGQIQT